jgi:ribonuclease D
MRVVATEPDLRALAREAAGATRLAVDLEASGMFAYRAAVCTVQLAWGDGDARAVVDAMAVSIAPLAELLGEGGPVKIVHDVAFDARMLAEAGVPLGNVHDTSLAARMLGRTATGLASLLESELGVRIGKAMQHHDWRIRPLDDAMLAYLAADVAHLGALEATLWREVNARAIEDAVLEETRYRLASALDAVRSPAEVPPYARVKGVDRLHEREKAVLERVAEVREDEARRRDVPPHRVISADALLAIARARPRTPPEVGRLKGVPRGPGARGLVEALARAVASAGETLAPEERARFERPRVPAAVLRQRREREGRLLAWRREEAKKRGVDEQVVLPGHCVKDVVDDDPADAEGLARVPGIGAFRVQRDAEAILRVLHAPPAPPPPAPTDAPPGAPPPGSPPEEPTP